METKKNNEFILYFENMKNIKKPKEIKSSEQTTIGDVFGVNRKTKQNKK